jgi:hypothetical protein
MQRAEHPCCVASGWPMAQFVGLVTLMIESVLFSEVGKPRATIDSQELVEWGVICLLIGTVVSSLHSATQLPVGK